MTGHAVYSKVSILYAMPVHPAECIPTIIDVVAAKEVVWNKGACYPMHMRRYIGATFSCYIISILEASISAKKPGTRWS